MEKNKVYDLKSKAKPIHARNQSEINRDRRKRRKEKIEAAFRKMKYSR